MRVLVLVAVGVVVVVVLFTVIFPWVDTLIADPVLGR